MRLYRKPDTPAPRAQSDSKNKKYLAGENLAENSDMEIYIHLPFCKAKCQYCDFNSYAACDSATIYSYLAALCREIKFAGAQYGRAKIDTVYIGGGTPSMLEAKQISSVCRVLNENFDLSGVKEFSIEANPESISEDKLAAYVEAGIDRISIGVQSLDDRNLRSVGRLHDRETALKKLELAGKYFKNVSADLIIGLPYDNAGLIKSEIDELSDLVSHMSVYQLTLEEGTPLKKRADEGRVWLPGDDEVAEFMDIAIDALAARGFERYEVSNFAKDGNISRHNMGYWTREEYIGLGAGSHSFLKTADGCAPLPAEIRFSHPRDINAYIGGINCVDSFDKIPRAEIYVLNEIDILNERIMLGLRTTKGVEESLLKGKISPELEEFFIRANGRIALNRRGMEVMNGILVRILAL